MRLSVCKDATLNSPTVTQPGPAADDAAAKQPALSDDGRAFYDRMSPAARRIL